MAKPGNNRPSHRPLQGLNFFTMAHQITLDTEEFLKALSRLKPKIIRKITKSDDLFITYLRGHGVPFRTSGYKTLCPILKAKWQGDVSVNFGTILSFLKVKPTGPEVNITYAEGRLKIENLSMPANRSSTPEEIASMSASELSKYR